MYVVNMFFISSAALSHREAGSDTKVCPTAVRETEIESQALVLEIDFQQVEC